jgi:hypothetical protein
MRSRFLVCSILVLILVLAAGCASKKKTSEIMQSWMGQHVSRLIDSWGPPSNETDDGRGGKVYTWAYSRYVQPSAYTWTDKSGHAWTNVSGGQTYTSVRQFWVDSGGVIYNWRWQGR